MSNASEATQLANRSGMTPQRLVVIFLLSSGFILALFFDHILSQAFAGLGWANHEVIEGLGWQTSTVIGVILGIAAVAGSWLWPAARELMSESAAELMKVTWPTGGETKSSTIAVVVASVITALFLFAVDTLSYHLMVEWLPVVWGKL
jgi:preprotein translocase subunit SecE